MKNNIHYYMTTRGGATSILIMKMLRVTSTHDLLETREEEDVFF
ncbi:hypothetical protein [Halalkalibacter urbisdiaboli]|nr:hypothetical protein [Halalkalibacter urbisdiaboli]